MADETQQIGEAEVIRWIDEQGIFDSLELNAEMQKRGVSSVRAGFTAIRLPLTQSKINHDRRELLVSTKFLGLTWDRHDPFNPDPTFLSAAADKMEQEHPHHRYLPLIRAIADWHLARERFESAEKALVKVREEWLSDKVK